MIERFENFTYLVNKIYRNIQKIKLMALKKYGLKGSHMMCIYHLGKENRKLSFKELCDICDEDKGLISRNLSYLKKEKYVNEITDDNQIYKGKLELSEKGKEAFNEIHQLTVKICEKVYLDKEKTSLDDFYKNLEEISDRIELLVKGGNI